VERKSVRFKISRGCTLECRNSFKSTNDGRYVQKKAEGVSTRAISRPSPTCNKNFVIYSKLAAKLN
jgi:hypothetical protein